ncbi:G-protein coupled receptor GRL101-like protein [Trichoplax sp. H2]|nr:G-protein coupled receptor GRL101-like protein [Trichoplax sp. H2]|eukprot:RDD36312.1 G-protein coupled receptor GRL101-like protein [Trichoplax sp. H2]
MNTTSATLYGYNQSTVPLNNTHLTFVTDLIIRISISLGGFISVVAVFGNLFNIFFIYRYPNLHNMNNLIIANLSFIDFFNGLIVIPMIVVFGLTGRPVYSLCQFQGFILTWLYTASLTTSAAVSTDRLYAIMYPFRYYANITVKKLCLTMICIWFVPTIIAVIPLLALGNYGLGKYRYMAFCAVSFIFYSENYTICWILISFIIITIIIILCSYLAIFTIAYRKTVRDLSHSGNLKKSIRTTSLIVGTNLLCWLPYLFLNFAQYIDRVNNTPDINSSSRSGPTSVVAIFLLFSNAAINPIIYMVTNSYLRKQIWYLFCKTRVHPIP